VHGLGKQLAVEGSINQSWWPGYSRQRSHWTETSGNWGEFCCLSRKMMTCIVQVVGFVVVIVSGMQLLRLRIAIHRHHPPQKGVLNQICCPGSIRWWHLRSCWMVLSHVMRGRPGCLPLSTGGEANRILLPSAFSAMHTLCPNRVSQCDWIIAASLGCFVSLLKLWDCILQMNKTKRN